MFELATFSCTVESEQCPLPKREFWEFSMAALCKFRDPISVLSELKRLTTWPLVSKSFWKMLIENDSPWK